MKFLIIGCGSIGKRHIENLLELNHSPDNICVWNRGAERLNQVKKLYKVKTFTSLEGVFKTERPNISFICSPTSKHLENAYLAAKYNCDIFIEKPISHNSKNLGNFRTYCKKKKLIVQVASNLRFHLGPSKILKIINNLEVGDIIWAEFYCGMSLPTWHPKEDYKKMYSSKKKLGGGVLLDIIHEIDLACWFFGTCKNVIGRSYNSGTLDIETDEFADLILLYKDKNVCIHLDYIQNPYSRGIKVIGKKGILTWSLEDNFIKLYKNKKKEKKIIFPKNYKKNDMYVEQLKYFIKCVKKRQQPHNNIQSGIDSLKIVEKLKK